MTRSIRPLLVASVLALALGACGDVVSIEPVADYQTWSKLETRGNAPGHEDSIRIIYANAVAGTYVGSGQYPLGTVLVKEVYAQNGDQPGALRYVALMRRLDTAPAGGAIDGGWLFTESETAGGEETNYALCWARCHVSAPYHGAWFDYAKAPPAMSPQPARSRP